MTLYGSIIPGPVTTPDGLTTKVLYQLGDDYKVLGSPRSCASGGCPAVSVLRDASDTAFTKDWQFFFYAHNMDVSLAALTAILSIGKALFNTGGLSDHDDPRQNWLSGLGTNLSYKPPKMDKLRTFNLATHAGIEIYSLTFAIQNIFIPVVQRSFMGMRNALVNFTASNALELKTLDGRNPPPLKPGRSLPKTLAEVDPSVYAVNPKDNRELFMACSNVKWRFSPLGEKYLAYGPFDHGAVRSWLDDGLMYSFFPLVSIFRIISPLRFWTRIPIGSKFPSPYRRR